MMSGTAAVPPVVRPSIFGGERAVVAAFSTRNGGVSPPPLGMNFSYRVGDRPENVKRNREIFFGSLGIRTNDLAIPGQVHGTTVLRADNPGSYAECDGLITATRGVFLCVSVADCVPILLFDPGVPALAAVHAGWRGTVGRIAEVAVRAMEREFGVKPGRLLAYLGPAAGSCCYVVGEEVSSRFEPRFVRRVEEGATLDLKGANREQLLEVGVPTGQMETSPFCTISESAQFHSFRREGDRSGRMIAVIGLI
jgi:YfiH family protein